MRASKLLAAGRRGPTCRRWGWLRLKPPAFVCGTGGLADGTSAHTETKTDDRNCDGGDVPTP